MKSSGVRVNVSAPGKVILHGEHSVVYGKLALAASIGLRTNVTLEENCESDGFLVSFDADDIKFELSGVENFLNKIRTLQYDRLNPESLSHNDLLSLVEEFLGEKDINGTKLTSLKTLFYLFGAIASVIKNLNPIHLRISTELNIGAGTGSSASFSVCLAAAFFQFVKIKHKVPLTEQFSHEDLNVISNWAFCAEKIIHGLPSGVDNTICTYGTMVEFRKGQTPTLIKLKSPLKVLLINTKVPRETKKMVEIARKVFESKPDYFNNTLERLENIAKEAIVNITNLNNDSVDTVGCYRNLHNLAEENHELLKNLGVSHEKLDEIVAILKDNKLGGKLTGAGGGGYALTLVPPSFPQVHIQMVINKLNSCGFHAVLTDLGGPGVRLS